MVDALSQGISQQPEIGQCYVSGDDMNLESLLAEKLQMNQGALHAIR